MIPRQEKNKIGNKFCDSVKPVMAMAFCGINNKYSKRTPAEVEVASLTGEFCPAKNPPSLPLHKSQESAGEKAGFQWN